MPTEEELKEFIKIPKTPLGKLKAMNDCFLKQDNLQDAMKQMMLFMEYLIKNKPEYYEALKDCKTEEEIKKASGEFFANHPEMIEEVFECIAAAQRDMMFKGKEKK